MVKLAWFAHIWPSVGKITELARLLLAELYAYAIDFGFGSHQADAASRILLSSMTTDLHGQVVTRLREVMSRFYVYS
jgi:hypothetical protein